MNGARLGPMAMQPGACTLARQALQQRHWAASGMAPAPREAEVATEARQLRAEVEDALNAAGWPWIPSLSRVLDSLISLEEAAQ